MLNLARRLGLQLKQLEGIDKQGAAKWIKAFLEREKQKQRLIKYFFKDF